jgi:hypothetical protein
VAGDAGSAAPTGSTAAASAATIAQPANRHHPRTPHPRPTSTRSSLVARILGGLAALGAGPYPEAPAHVAACGAGSYSADPGLQEHAMPAKNDAAPDPKAVAQRVKAVDNVSKRIAEAMKQLKTATEAVKNLEKPSR